MMIPEKPTEDPGNCEECGAPFYWAYKFNGGTPGWFIEGECHCLANKLFSDFMERRKNRKNDEPGA